MERAETVRGNRTVRIQRIAATGALALVTPFIATPIATAATPLCFGKVPTIVGTDGSDSIYGTAGVDVIHAGLGADYVRGEGEANTPGDFICGGPGADDIRGSRSGDKINGGDGNDVIYGYFGVDVLQGNAGNDQLGDSDDDGDWEDRHDPGTDIFRGDGGDDFLWSTAGSDKLYGADGRDTVNDVTRAKTYLYGGPGSDVFDSSYMNLGTSPIVADVVSGDAGTDKATVNRLDSVTPTTERVIRVN